MSDKPAEGSVQDELLEKNIGRLLEGAHEPPKMDPKARGRVLARLIETTGADRADAGGERAHADIVPLASRWRRRGGLALAAAAAAVFVWSIVGEHSHSSETFANEGVAPTEHELVDGSRIILRGGAEVVTVGARRVRMLRGEAIFDVVPGPEKFVVETPHGQVTVLGTRFSLRATEAATVAAVIRGTVSVENEHGEAKLAAGELGTLASSAPPTREPAPRLSHMTSWARALKGEGILGEAKPARRGNLLAREPNWQQQEYPLPMRKLTVDVHVENQVARVAIDQTFFNHKSWQLEGVYSFPLPADAAISRLAMYVDGTLTEAGIVERQRGREIYESIVYRRRDPALLEWMSGNEFRVRIFPLPARTEKRILLSYTQSLERLYDGVRLEVPIPEVDAPVGSVNYRVRVADCGRCEIRSSSHKVAVTTAGEDAVVTFEAQRHRIGDDLILNIQSEAPPATMAVSRDDDQRYWMARLRPALGGVEQERQPRRWVILHDTSASRGRLELLAQRHLIRRFLREFDERDEVQLIAFDAAARAMPGGFTRVDEADADSFANFAADRVDGVGETDFAAALERAVGALAEAGPGFDSHILYLGDGIVTASERDVEELVAKVSDRGITVVTVAVGEKQDAVLLGALAEATSGMFVRMNLGEDLDWRAFDTVAALNTPRALRLEAEPRRDGEAVKGDFYLSSRQLADGEELVVVGRSSGAPPDRIAIRGEVAGKPFERAFDLSEAASGAGYVPRLWAQRRVEALRLNAEANRAEITELGMKHWLITPFTSLIVLENDAMYRQYRVARSSASGWAAYSAPAKIDVVREPTGGSGVDLAGFARDGIVVRQKTQLFHSPQFSGWGAYHTQTIGVGGLGTIGVGGLGMIGAGAGGAAFASSTEVNRDLLTLGYLSADQQRSTGRVAIDSTVAQPRGDENWVVADREAPAMELVAEDEILIPSNQSALEPMSGFIDFRSTRSAGARYLWAGLQHPAAYHYTGDPRLSDLTEFVPAMMSSVADSMQQALLREWSGDTSPVSTEVRTMIERARQSFYGASFELPNRLIVSVASDGTFRGERRTDLNLLEKVQYDGDVLIHSYPELGISVRRQVGVAEPALLRAHLPFLLARPERIAVWYDATASGGSLLLTSRKDDRRQVRVDFDTSGRPQQVIYRLSDRGEQKLRFDYRDGVISVAAGGGEAEYRRVKGGVSPSAIEETVVDMPLRNPEHWDSADQAGDAKRHALRQKLATYAALGNEHMLGVVAGELAKGGKLNRGELALASRGVRGRTRAQLTQIVTDVSDPVARFVLGSTQASELNALAEGATDSLISNLATYRVVLAKVTRSGGDVRAKAAAVRAAYRRLDSRFAYIVTWQLRQYHYYGAGANEVAALWRDYPGTGRWAVMAAHAAAVTLYSNGRYPEAAAEVERGFALAAELGMAPPLDHTSVAAVRNAGHVRWQRLWRGWRNRAMESGDPELIASFIASAGMFAEASDLDRAVSVLEPLVPERPELTVSVANALLAYGGRGDLAVRLLDGALAGSPADPAPIHMVAAQAKQRLGQLTAATEHLEAALETRRGPTSLAAYRSVMMQLAELHRRLVLAAPEAERDPAVARAMTAFAEWRAADPDNPALNRLAAELLFAAGRPEQAWRQLSTVIERRPGEGDAYRVVAEVLEGEGRIREAEALWQRAIAVEPTNPTWLLRRAQALTALGERERAESIIRSIVSRKWHERFDQVRREAERLSPKKSK